MPKKLLLMLCLALIIISIPGHVRVQIDAADLLIIVSEGDFWSWSEDMGLNRLTAGGDNWNFDRSPDGRTLA